MQIIEKSANKFAKKIATEMDYDNDKQEVIAYGTFAILQIVFSIALVVIFGLIFDVVIEALIVSFSTSLLRKYSGGVHASSSAICIIIGTITCVGFGLLSKTAFLLDLYVVLGFTFITFLLSYIALYRLAPVESKAKPISDKKKVKMKRGSIILLSIYLLINIILIGLYMYLDRINLINYVFCLSIGTLWQVFTLTKIGDVVLGGLDKLLRGFKD